MRRRVSKLVWLLGHARSPCRRHGTRQCVGHFAGDLDPGIFHACASLHHLLRAADSDLAQSMQPGHGAPNLDESPILIAGALSEN
jgi:hypothetical protein